MFPLKVVHGYNVQLEECPLRQRDVRRSTAESTRLHFLTPDNALELERQLPNYTVLQMRC